ncbi:MAG: hypothetical protein V1859_08340 [archaeon]
MVKKLATNSKTVKETVENVQGDRNKKNNDFILYGTIIAIIVFFVAGFLVLKYKGIIDNKKIDDSEKSVIEDSLMYNGYKFDKINSLWYSVADVDWLGKKTSYSVYFYYSPKETENISIEPKNIGTLLKLGDRPTVIISVEPTLDSKAVIAGTEISKILGKMFYINVKAALSVPEKPGAPVADCSNATNETHVVLIKYGQETKIYQKDNEGCIIIEAPNGPEFIRAADRLAYNLLGIDKKRIVVP